MPTYIEGDIPLGDIQSGQLVFKNVVIETALPYKPPSEGSIRGSAPCEGDTCRINSDYVPSNDDRAVLFLASDNLLLTVDGPDIMNYLSEGWKLVGVFDSATAETVAERIAANPPVDNDAIQRKLFMKRLETMGAVMATVPVAKIALIAGREKMLADDVALGRIAVPDPAQAAQNLSQSAQLGEQGWMSAEATAAKIDEALYPPRDYINTYVLVPKGVQTGGAMSSFFSLIRDSGGNLIPVNSIPTDLSEVIYVYPPYQPMDQQRSMGRQILMIVRSRVGLDNPYINSIFNRVNEWNSGQGRGAAKVETSTFGNDRPR